MVEVTQADNDLLVEITEWLIGEDAIDGENQRQLNRLGEFMEPRLAKHRLATIAALEQPTEAMWGGLARQIMMWQDMEPKTPRALFKHLERSGVDIPEWLRDEPEMRHLDHVPSKGTRCVLIFKAMIDAALKEPTQ